MSADSAIGGVQRDGGDINRKQTNFGLGSPDLDGGNVGVVALDLPLRGTISHDYE